MAKVLVLTNSIGGLYNFRRELMKELLEKEYEVIIAAPKDEKVSYFTKIGCRYIETTISRRGTNPITDFKLLMSYKEIVKTIKPNVVLTYTIKPNVYGGIICKALRVPYIANITGLGTAVKKQGVLQNLTLFLYWIALKKASCVFFQNKDNQQFFLHKKIVADKYRLIPGSGVNLEHFQLMDYTSDETIEFLFIGRIMKEKGIDQYLEAAEYIKNKYPNTVFNILGSCEDDYTDKLKGMQESGIVLYHGRQDDVREFHKISHCTIHPSYYPEGMSNVLLESAACGRPIITTDKSGCREVIDDGITGFIVEHKNSKDLINKVEKFIGLSHGEKKSMGLAGRRKVEVEFNRQIVVNAYLKEIDTIINME